MCVKENVTYYTALKTKYTVDNKIKTINNPHHRNAWITAWFKGRGRWYNINIFNHNIKFL